MKKKPYNKGKILLEGKMTGSWICEKHTEGYAVKWKIKDILHEEQTRYQKLAVVDTLEWGKALLLDDALQISEKDEFIYHEMISHVGMCTHPCPERVLIIGGGDGGTLREVLKHQQLNAVDLVEIDERVVENSKRFFPALSCGFTDRRLNLHIADGVHFVKETSSRYDVIIVDSSDPLGPATPLFNLEFYQDVYKILKEDGLLVVQSESPVFYGEVFRSVYRQINTVFPLTRVFLAPIATYVSGPWSFTMGSKKYNPWDLAKKPDDLGYLKYYNEGIHRAAFCLPPYIKEMLQD